MESTVSSLPLIALRRERSHSIDCEQCGWKIQRWLKRMHFIRNSFVNLNYSNDKVVEFVNILKLVAVTSDMSKVQSLLMQEKTLKLCATVLSTFHWDPIIKDKNSNIMLARKIITGIMMSKFPKEVFGEEADLSEIAVKTITITKFAAKILHRQFEKILLFALKETPPDNFHSMNRKVNLFRQFQFVVRFFLQKFREWKAIDAETFVKSMEDAFIQTYTAYIVAQLSLKKNGNTVDEELIKAAEQQLIKIRQALSQVLPNQVVVSRLTSLQAMIESNYPEYSQDNQSSSTTQQETREEQPVVLTTESSSDLHTIAAPNPTTAPSSSSSSNIPASTATSSSTSSSIEGIENTKYLQLLSKIAGMGNERLAYELTLDKYFRLPVEQKIPSTSTLSRSTLSQQQNSNRIGKKISLPQLLKEKMLNLLADKLMNSLRRSNIIHVEDLQVGWIIPIKQDDESSLTAEILQIMTEQHQQDSVGNSTLEVKYLADETVEQNIALHRVKLYAEISQGDLFIHLLYDIIQSIASFTPNLSDLRTKLLQCFDPQLMQQIIMAGSIDAKRDIYPIMHFLFHHLLNLQAEYRMESARQWWLQFEQTFLEGNFELFLNQSQTISRCFPLKPNLYQEITTTTETGIVHSSTNINHELYHRFEKFIDFIPIYFEKMTDYIKDIQRDVSID
jgi:hypothetical protein